jgi:hypothetical protein
MCTVCMASDITLGTPPRVLTTEGEHETTVTAPVSTDIRKGLKAMGNTVVDLLFVILNVL